MKVLLKFKRKFLNKKQVFISLLLLLPYSLFADDNGSIKSVMGQLKKKDGSGFLGMAKFVENFASNISGLVTGITQNRNARKVFYLFMAIFALVNTLYFIYQQNIMKEKKQWTDVLQTGFKIVECCALMAILPFIPGFLIKLMWALAEYILGQQPGTMSYSLPIINFGKVVQYIFGGIGTGLTVTSIIHPAAFGTSIVSGISLGNFSSLVYIFGFMGLGGVIVSTITYLVSCLSLYISVFGLILHIPSTIFDGFNYKLMNTIKYFWVNSIKIFLGAIIIILILKQGEEHFGGGLPGILSNLVFKPLFLSCFLPLSSLIISNLAQGSTSGDDAHSVRGAVGQATGSAIAGGKALSSGGSEISKNFHKNKDEKAENDKIKTGLAEHWAKSQGTELTDKEREFFQGLDDNVARSLAKEFDKQEAVENMKGLREEKKQ